MGYAIKCYFTQETAKPIYEIWNALADTGLATFLKESGSKPGISLCVWENTQEDSLLELLHNFTKLINELPKLSTFGVATFPTNPSQVFLGITPTAQLLSFHRFFHNLAPSLTLKGSPYYQPDEWVPHSTLAIRCSPTSVSQIIDKCLQHETILQVKIGAIGLLETGTARQIDEVVF
ncbi:MAG: hypothetical protein ACXWRE_11780 [Pseudobdellovibrionaceae bacterium]